MNEYGAEMPLWDGDGHTDGQALDLSDGLRADLCAFDARWDAAAPEATFDDRFDHVPWLRTLVDAARSVRHLMRPGARRDAAVEDAWMRQEGERLRGRLQSELGERFAVTYKH